MVFALGGAIYGVVHLTGSAWAGLREYIPSAEEQPCLLTGG